MNTKKKLSNPAKTSMRAVANSEGIPDDRIEMGFAAMEGHTSLPSAQPIQQELYPVSGAMAFLHSSRSSLIRAEKKGRLHPVWFGGRKLYRREDLINALQEGGTEKT